MARHALALFLLFVACASVDSARYVQFREAQANLNERTADALEAGLIDVATAKRVLAMSEAVSQQAEAYREALAEGRPRSVTRGLLDAIGQLLQQADLLLARGTAR